MTNNVVSDARAQIAGPHKRLLTLKEAGAYIGLSHWRVRSLIFSGQLAYVRMGRRILIDLKDLDELIDSKKQREGIRLMSNRGVRSGEC